MKTLWHESIDDIADIINSGATVKNDALYNLMEDIQCLMEELETLRAENAKLIAERDEVKKIPDCKFGDNLVWFLREFENAEKEYLEESCLEIYGEDANGREGSTEITVNEICREAANAIEKLLAEREQWMKQEPVFYYRPTSSGGYEGPIFAGSIENCRINSGKWKPLFSHPLPAQQIPEGYKFERFMNHILVTAPDGGQDVVYADEPLYKLLAVLSASQPKGDV